MKIRARLMLLILFAGIGTVMLFLFSLQPMNGIYAAMFDTDGVSRYDLQKLLEAIRAEESGAADEKPPAWERAADRAKKLHPGTLGLILQVIRPDGSVFVTVAPKDDTRILGDAGIRFDEYSIEDLARLYENPDGSSPYLSIVRFIPLSADGNEGGGGILGIVTKDLATGISLNVPGRSGMIFILLMGSGLVSAILASFVVILFGTGSVLRRFRNLNRGIEAVMAGDLSVRLHDRGGDEIAFLGRSFDTMIDRLAEQKQSEEKAEEEKRYVVASLSHDLRTPLSSIMGYAESLRDAPEQSEVEIREQAGIIREKSEYMKRLLVELLDFSTTGSPSLVLMPKQFDFYEFLRTLLIGFLPRIRERRVELNADIPDERLPIYADETLLTRAFENIVSNALSYGDIGGTLTAKVESDALSGGTVSVLVMNSGSPIPEGSRERLFDGFYRADASRHGEGLGLGLTISRNIIRKHGGELSLESSDGKKTVFRITLPVEYAGLPG